MTFTPAEKGVVSSLNSITLIPSGGGQNTTVYNTNMGNPVAANLTSITLANSASTTPNAYQFLVIEIVSGAGKNQHRQILAYSAGRVATVASWSVIPDEFSVYIVHQNSGSLPIQIQPNSISSITLPTTNPFSASNNYFTNCYVKLLDGRNNSTVRKILSYNGSTKVATIDQEWPILPLLGSLIIIYSESGMASGGTSNSITLDGFQSAIVNDNAKNNHLYIEVFSGTAIGQIREVNSIAGNVLTISPNWTINPVSTDKYTIFAGWAGTFESVLNYSQISILETLTVAIGQNALVVSESSHDAVGTNHIDDFADTSYERNASFRVIGVVANFFRLKIISNAVAINGTFQTIFSVYKSGVTHTSTDVSIASNSDCALSRSIMVARGMDDIYRNIVSSERGVVVDINGPTDPFGNVITISPVSFVDLTFKYGINKLIAETFTQTGSAGKTGTVIQSNALAWIATGTGIGSVAILNSIRRVRYTPGFCINCRFSATFTTDPNTGKGIAGTTQLAGIGDENNGLFFGFLNNPNAIPPSTGTDFGILRRTSGINTIQQLTVTAAATGSGNLTINLDGGSTTIPVVSGDNIQTVAYKIANSPTTPWTGVGGGFKVINLGALVKFISYIPGSIAAGTFSAAATGVTISTGANLVVLTVGVSQQDNWIRREDWNIDRADTSRVLTTPIFGNGNIFDISYQWLGFGLIVFKIEDSTTGHLQTVHMLRYANSNPNLVIRNPNLPLYFYTSNGATTSNMIVTTGSCSINLYGVTSQTTGPRFSFSNMRTTDTINMSANLVHHVLSVRNLLLTPTGQGNLENVSEIFIISINISALLGTTVRRGGTFYVYLNPTYDISAGTGASLIWNEIDNANSLVVACNTTTTITSGTEITSYPTGVDAQGYINTLPLEFYVRAGNTIAIGYKPLTTLTGNGNSSGDVGACITWIERI